MDVFEKVMAFSSNPQNKEQEGSPAQPEKKQKISDRMLDTLSRKGYDLSQLEAVLRQQGHQLIVSCAGSGKTTALVLKVSYDQLTGFATKVVEINGSSMRVAEKTRVCTFLKSGADELRSAMVRWQRELGIRDTSDMVSFGTLHAEFKSALTALGLKTDIVASSTNMAYLKKVCTPYMLTNADGRPYNSEDWGKLSSSLAYTRNRLDDKRYETKFYTECSLNPKVIDCILSDWQKMRVDNGVLDFEDLQEVLYDYCYLRKDEEIIRYLQGRYSFIYLDEAQDTSQIQYALLQIYAQGCRQFVVIGDDDQTIYSWRGSDSSVLTEKIPQDFNPVINTLSTNFRCPTTILNAIKPSIAINQNRYEKDLKSSKDGGRVRIGGYSSYRTMVDALGDLVYDDVQKGKKVAILCRINSDGLAPALMLERAKKFSFSISGEGMTLDSYVGRLVLGIVKLFTDNSSSAVKTVLKQLSWNSFDVDKLMKVCSANKLSFWKLPEDDIARSCPGIYGRLKTWRQWREDFGDIRALKLVLEDYRINIFVKRSQFNNVVKTTIESISTMLDSYDYQTAHEFLEDLEDVNFRLNGYLKNSRPVNVQITTVHEFKGKEADSVYIWNDSIDVFPHKDCNMNDPEQLEEERRIHYIACTRAKEISTIMHLNRVPGMFVSEMDLSEAEILDVNEVKGVLRPKEGDEAQSFRAFEAAQMQEYQNELETSTAGNYIDFAKLRASNAAKKEREEAERAKRDYDALDGSEGGIVEGIANEENNFWE